MSAKNNANLSTGNQYQYSPKIKKLAVALAHKKTIAASSRYYGIPSTTLSRWVHERRSPTDPKYTLKQMQAKPHKNYLMKFKMEVVAFAASTSIPSAAKKFQLPLSNVYSWKKLFDSSKSSEEEKSSNSTHRSPKSKPEVSNIAETDPKSKRVVSEIIEADGGELHHPQQPSRTPEAGRKALDKSKRTKSPANKGKEFGPRRYSPSFKRHVLEYGKLKGHFAAVKAFDVPRSTYHTWLCGRKTSDGGEQVSGEQQDSPIAKKRNKLERPKKHAMETKLTGLAIAQERGARAAAEELNVAQRTIYEWLAAAPRIIASMERAEERENTSPSVQEKRRSEKRRRSSGKSVARSLTRDMTLASNNASRTEEADDQPLADIQAVMMQQLETTHDSDSSDSSAVYDDSTLQSTYVVDEDGRLVLQVDAINGKTPTSRWGCTLDLIETDKVLLVGGQNVNFNKDSCWMFSSDQLRWKQVTTEWETVCPEPRTGHTITYDQVFRCVYMFGGSKLTRWFKDVQMLNLDTQRWQQLETSGESPMRSYHTTVLHGHNLLMFGGNDPHLESGSCCNDLLEFNTAERCWRPVSARGTPPSQRSGHSATVIEYTMVVFGGWDEPVCVNDVHYYNLQTQTWTRPRLLGRPPSPRSWHAACPLTQKRVFIHGGYNAVNCLGDAFILDVVTGCWTSLIVPSELSPRTGHVACSLPLRTMHDQDGSQDQVLVFGGGNNEKLWYDSSYVVTLPTFARKSIF